MGCRKWITCCDLEHFSFGILWIWHADCRASHSISVLHIDNNLLRNRIILLYKLMNECHSKIWMQWHVHENFSFNLINVMDILVRRILYFWLNIWFRAKISEAQTHILNNGSQIKLPNWTMQCRYCGSIKTISAFAFLICKYQRMTIMLLTKQGRGEELQPAGILSTSNTCFPDDCVDPCEAKWCWQMNTKLIKQSSFVITAFVHILPGIFWGV